MAEDVILAANASDCYEAMERIRRVHKQTLRTFSAASCLHHTTIKIARVLLFPGYNRRPPQGRDTLAVLQQSMDNPGQVWRIGPHGEILPLHDTEVSSCVTE